MKTRLLVTLAVSTLVGVMPSIVEASTGDAAVPTGKRAAVKRERVYYADDWLAGTSLGRWHDSCTGGAPAGSYAVAITVRDPSPDGDRAVGFEPSGVGQMFGIHDGVRAPQSLSRFRISINHPDHTVQGQATVRIALNRSGTDEWVGRFGFVDTTDGWHVVNAAGASFDWTHVTDGVAGEVVEGETVRSFAASLSGIRSTRLGFEFGCDGSTVFFDDLEIGTDGSAVRSYDFDGYHADVVLDDLRYERCQQSARRYPRRVTFTGSTSYGPVGIWQVHRDDSATLLRERSARGSFSLTVDLRSSGRYAAFHRSTPLTEYAWSQLASIPVFPKVAVHGKRSVIRGRALTASGRVTPHRALPYRVLYSQWRGGRWTPFRSVHRGRTNARGAFSFKVPTAQVGYARVNVLTLKTSKLASTISRDAVRYLVRKPPAPHHPHSAPTPPTPPTDTGGHGGTTTPDPHSPPPPARVRPSGYGACGWFPTGGRRGR